MNPSHQPQRNGTVPPPPVLRSWDGDQMLHIYLCDYLRKRGYSQAAHALSSEARLEPERKVPIDSPESLLFEWWVVFWEVLASKSTEMANVGLSEDARVYGGVRPVGIPEAAYGGVSQVMVNGNGHQMQPSGTTAAQHTVNGRRPSQTDPHLYTRPNEPSTSTSSTHPGPSAQPSAVPQQRRRSSLSFLPSLDLEASATLGLHRPASRSVIQQCMDMMNLGAKQIIHLTAAERQALAKRVNRVQSAQNDAQMALVQLHGLQQKTPMSGQGVRKAQEGEGYGERVGGKRRISPSADQEMEQGTPVQAGPGPVQSMRRLSQPAVAAVPASSPLTPMNAGMPFSQVSPHTMMQSYSPSSAPAPMAPPPRRRSLRANELVPGDSAHRMVHSSGLTVSPLSMTTSMSPIAEWPTIESQQAIPPLQQQRPGVPSYGFEAYQQPQIPPQPTYAHTHPSLQGQSQTRTNVPLGNAHLNARPPVNTLGPKPAFQVGIPPTPPSSAKGFANGRVDAPMAQQGGAPMMPYAELEWELNMLLSNPPGREETAAFARQLGDVGGS